eukprot:TRINITY_DN100537_c0_g1_i1.p1 TRINITY_DN100537_c0_g1~~TRINITY_DN100537_c0_g1_i1.p1  ORF type:complete len:260 (+),score=45.91 TRINITY_DN100537_c0_g1_i1:109-888(+)
MGRSDRNSRNKSVGVLPSSGCFDGFTRGDMRRMYYRTTTASQVPVRAPLEGSEAENFIDLHMLGNRNSKYGRYKVNKAPLADHSALQSRRDFVQQPLEDFLVNKQLAQVFKDGWNAREPQTATKQTATTKNLDDFRPLSGSQVAAARPQSCKPPQEQTKLTGGDGPLLVTTTTTHQQFQTPNAALAKVKSAKKPKTNLEPSGPAAPPTPLTAHQRQFPNPRLLARCSSAPPGGRSDDLAQIAIPKIEMVRRACYLSPGQ